MSTLPDPLADYCARRDITDALHRYMSGLDRLDEALCRSAFHPDAHIDCGVYVGDPKGFIAFAFDFLGPMRASHHLLGQTRIILHDPKTASGESYFQAWHAITGSDGNPRDLIIAGRYIDEYTCRNGLWRITHRKLISEWASDTPATGAAYLDGDLVHRSARGGEDFAQTRLWPNR